MIEIFFSPCYEKEDQNFYIDSRNGNDRTDGQSPKTSWRSLKRIKKANFSIEDSLLLHKGSVFTGILKLSVKGKAENPFVVDAYGSDWKPRIQAPNVSFYTVLVCNSDYLRNIQ